MNLILSMYVTLMPSILAGILTMIWCKAPFLEIFNSPIDGGITLKDGKRIFGDNKTWKGLLGYLVTNMFSAVLWGAVIAQLDSLKGLNYFYLNHSNTLSYNLLIGLLLGIGYALFELPNSFLKRRLDITPGKSLHGGLRWFFVFIDQADSIFGCALVVWLFHDIGIWVYAGFVAVGAFTHIVLNMLLYFCRLRKNMF